MRTYNGEKLKLLHRRVGVLPGSFNPPHVGHLRLAQLALERAALDYCIFYVNSFNFDKRRQLIALQHRLRLFEMMRQDERMLVLSADYCSDNIGGAYLSQDVVFASLLEKLASSFGQCIELVLVRGSDYFYADEVEGLSYPKALCDIPHVVGIRQQAHEHIRFAAISRKLLLKTPEFSSSLVRQALAVKTNAETLLESSSAQYVVKFALFT